MTEIEKANQELKEFVLIYFHVIDEIEDKELFINFYIYDSDYDYENSVTFWMSNNELNNRIFEYIKEHYSSEYTPSEFDCNGSKQIRFYREFSKDNKYIRIRCKKHIDV